MEFSESKKQDLMMLNKKKLPYQMMFITWRP